MTIIPIRNSVQIQMKNLYPHADYLSHLRRRYPKMAPVDTLISDKIISPFDLHLPKTILRQAQEYVRAAYYLRDSKDYRSKLASMATTRNLIDPGNKSILMSYDFHVGPNNQIKLIEINTNASFLALGEALYESRGISQPISDFTIDELRENIFEELELFGQPNTRPTVAILDEDPLEQKLYAEFLIYQELMTEWGFQPQIKGVGEITGEEDFIYNRYTDFYLERPESANLRKLYLEKRVCFSPHPFEYFLLADKERLIDWANFSIPPVLQQHTPSCQQLTKENAGELWAKRKGLFFKPLRSFGAKQSFRGASISRKAFEELIPQEILAQEFIVAPEILLETPLGPQQFKYDLRFYAYKDRVQSVLARIYQGQVTNMRTPFGGFSPVIFVD